MPLPRGQRDFSTVRLSRHALERFVERFAAEPAVAVSEFRGALARPAGWAATPRTARSPCWASTATRCSWRSFKKRPASRS